jgi:hypothetical protein
MSVAYGPVAWLLIYELINGNSAMWRARLSAVETMRWCLEQVPVLVDDRILA